MEDNMMPAEEKKEDMPMEGDMAEGEKKEEMPGDMPAEGGDSAAM